MEGEAGAELLAIEGRMGEEVVGLCLDPFGLPRTFFFGRPVIFFANGSLRESVALPTAGCSEV